MKFRWYFVLLLAAIGLALLWHFFAPKKNPLPSANAQKSIPVTVTSVSRKDVKIWLSGIGTVQAYNKVTVRPRVSGVLDEIHFTEGATVKAGDVLARIDPRPYQSILAQAKAKQAQSTAQLSNARIELDRVTNLLQSGAESRQKFDSLQATVAQYVAQEQADAASVQAAELDLEFTTVKAPISGRTGVRLIDQGNLVTASQEGGLVVITQFQPISVIFTLSQQNLASIQKRTTEDKSPLIAQALTDDGAILAEGKLELIDNEIDTTTGTIKLKATFANTEESLWPGQFVTARILVQTRKQAEVVPTQAIQTGLNGPFAYVVKADKKVEARPLKPGPQVEDITLIEEGLQEGEQIVLDGQSKLQPGASVTVQPTKP